MIVVISNNNTNTKKINFKEEEEDEEAINQQFKSQSQQTSLILNVTNVIDMAIISQNVELIWIDKMVKGLTLQKKKKCLFWWCVTLVKELDKTCNI